MNDNAEGKIEVPAEEFKGVKIFFNATGEIQFEIKELSIKQLLQVAMKLDLVKNIFFQSVLQRVELDEREKSSTDQNQA
jgi:hypothetical protein